MELGPRIHRLVRPALTTYWKVVKPKTFGARGLVLHPDSVYRALFVQHTYGNTERWSIPGGRYYPRSETAEHAFAREVEEEIRLKLDATRPIGDYYTEAEGKRDTVALFVGRATTAAIRQSSEIRAFRWVDVRHLEEQLPSITTVASYAVRLYIGDGR